MKYRAFDAEQALEMIASARRLTKGSGPIRAWMRRSCATLQCTAEMLGSIGKRSFSVRSRELYGTPTTGFPGTERTPLELARRLIRATKRAQLHMPDPPEPSLGAGDVAFEIRRAVVKHFGKSAPEVLVVPTLAARASAGPTRIRLRRGAKFSDLDVNQLIHHEAFVHVGTSLNGKKQKKFPLLASNHAGTTRTQEGLAVFAELMSGALDPARLLRLAHRVIAVQMALDGGDFLDVYRYFRENSPNETEAYASASRVFRGGPTSGGSPFVKDIVYLDGLSRVHVFMRSLVISGRLDCLPLVFLGKCDLEDVEALADLSARGWARRPMFVPPWVKDPRRLVAYFSITDGIGRAASAGMRKYYQEQLERMPTAVGF